MAVEKNTIVTTDLAPEITIDHVNRLVTGIASLQKVLGVGSMVPMAAGTTVYQYKYTRKNTPDQVAEGEVIPLTEYTRSKTAIATLELRKYRKQSTAEAIQKFGRQVAINDTDDLLIKEVQKDVKAAFYTSLSAGTGTVTGSVVDFQHALASVWGAVQSYFADIDATMVSFVNPLDAAAYLGGASVSTQTAFGLTYIENFLGLGTVIVYPSVTEGTVIGTAAQNINGVYVPASGDVAQSFGLAFDATGMVGMKHFTADDRASVDTLILSGVSFYAEDKGGIFKGKITPATGA